MIVTKAIVKLPRKNHRTGSLVVDTTDYKPHQQEEGSYYLVTDKLYFDGLPCSVIENEIKDLVSSFNPIKVHLNHTTECACGYIQFVTKDMADRAYTLLNGTTFRAGIRLQLKINPPYGDYPEPEAHAGILHVKNLPNHIDNKSLYELFRPFGPMMLCKILLEQATTFKGNALVQYFNSEHAQDAEHLMNNKQLQDNIITVLPFVSNNNNKWRDTTPPTPSSNTTVAVTSHGNSTPSSNNTVTIATPSTTATTTTTNTNTTVVAPVVGTNTPPAPKDTTVDYTNLYIKNLDLNVKSADLFEHFRKFGRIISARVMKNAQTKQSKGFGFVSYSKADEAQKAKGEMDGVYILSKPIIVAFHEPKKPRENEVQVNSTTPPMDTPSYVDHLPYYQQQHQQQQQQHQQHQQHQQQQQQQQQQHAQQQQQHQRSRDFEHRYSHIPPPPQTPPPVVAPTGKYNHYAVPQTHQIHQHYSPQPQQHHQQQHHPHQSHVLHSSHVDYPTVNKLYQPMERNTSRHSNSYDPRHGQQIHLPPVKHEHYQASTPVTKRDHPMQQTSLSALASGAYINTPPNYYGQEIRPTFRRRGSIESVASVMTETTSETRRHTVTKAVLSIEKEHHDHVEDIVDMILTLKKKDLATCLFNKVVLKAKIRQAKDALDIFQQQEVEKKTVVTPISRAIPIVAPTTKHPDWMSEEIEKFLETLKGLALHEKKQLLGDRLFPLVKSTGVKQAPKITIRLLDSVPLDELAYAMYDKDKLKHQVSRIVSAISTRY